MADVPVLKNLSEYLAEVASRRWQAGVLDCGVFMADWVVRRCGSDPISDVRGSYSTDDAFHKIVRREGGLVKSCGARLGCVGFEETSSPEAGDVLVVLAPTNYRGRTIQAPTGSIMACCGLRAVVTVDSGLVFAGDQLKILGAWRPAHG